MNNPPGSERPVPGRQYHRAPRRPFARRALFGLADQALYSLTNFSLAICIATTVGVREFGAFAALLIAHALTLGVSNALTSEVFTVLYSAKREEDLRYPLAAGAGAALGVGLLGALLALGITPFATGPLRDALPIFALTVPGIFLQDYWRYVFFAVDRASSAFFNDLLWAAVQTLILVFLITTSRATVATFLLAWGTGALAGALLGMAQSHLVPRALDTWTWLSTHRALGVRFASEWLTLYGAAQFVLAALAAVSGLTELARLRAAWLLFGPLQGFLNGIRLSVTPLAVAISERQPEQLRRFGTLLTAAITTLACLWTATALFLPRSVGVALLGASWTGADKILPPVAIGQMAAAASLGVLTVLRATRQAARSLSARTATAVCTLLFGVVGALLFDAGGAAGGMAAANLIGLALLIRAARATLIERDGVNAESPDSSEYPRRDSGPP